MKFLIVTNLYKPFNRGGAEAVVETSAHGLREAGHEVKIFSAGPKSYGICGREETVDDILVFRFFPLNIFFVRDDYKFNKLIRAIWRVLDIFNFHSAWELFKILKKEKPNVVITHNLVGVGMLLPIIIKIKNIKHIHVLHDVQLIYPSGLLIYGKEKKSDMFLPRIFYEIMMIILFGSPDYIISPSFWLLNLHKKHGFCAKSKTFILPNPVEENKTNQEPVVKNIEEKKEIKLCYAGQLEEHKGIMWLINSLAKGEENIKLSIAGTGSLQEKIIEMSGKYPNKFFYLGNLDRIGLETLFDQSDALVVPSLCYENSPRIISEALSFGLPVLASRIGGISEIIRDGENGILFDPLDTNQFFSALRALGNFVFITDGKVMLKKDYINKILEISSDLV